MKARKKAIALFLAIGLLLPNYTLAAEDTEVSVQRIGGKNRYETAQLIADRLGSNFEKIIIATGENYPDALAGSLLTESKYPILLTHKNEVSDAVKEMAHEAKEVIVLGGTNTITSEVEKQLADEDTKVTRIAGKNRYETAAMIAATSQTQERILVSGVNYPDAIVGAGLSLQTEVPILLTAPNRLTQETASAMQSHGIKGLTILGGSKAISEDVQAEAAKHLSTLERIAGADRYATSIEVARRYSAPKTMILATGEDFPDALTSAPLSGMLDAPILLVRGNELSPDLKDFLHDNRMNLEEVIIVGGEASVSNTLEESVRTYLQATSRTVSASRLHEMIKADTVKVIDLRNQELFLEGHIPGAMQIGNKEFEDPDNAVDGELATPEQFAALMSSYGITAQDTIVVYSDASRPQMAPRLVWTFENFGHRNVYVLDGHYQHWVAEGYATERGETTSLPTSDYEIMTTDSSINVGKEEVINRKDDTVLLDCRPVAEYTGETVASGNARGGHIPGAVNMPYMNTVTEDGFFKDPQTLKEMYAEIGITKDKEVIVYCQRGHRASHSWFVLYHILGFENVKVYDGSMMEWSNLPELPIHTGINP